MVEVLGFGTAVVAPPTGAATAKIQRSVDGQRGHLAAGGNRHFPVAVNARGHIANNARRVCQLRQHSHRAHGLRNMQAGDASCDDQPLDLTRAFEDRVAHVAT